MLVNMLLVPKSSVSTEGTAVLYYDAATEKF